MPLIVTYKGDAGKLLPVMDPQNALVKQVRLPGGVHYPAGTVLGEVASVTPADEVQTVTITGTPTGGSFRLLFNGKLTAPIAHNADAAAVQSALEALPNVGAGNVACAGGPLPGTPVTVTYQGALAKTDVPLLTAISSLTGGTNPAVTVAETTPGNPGGGLHKAYDGGATDGTEVAKLLLQYDVVTDEAGMATVGGGEHQEKTLLVPAYFCGTFKTKDLTGLDAAAVADLGRLISGGTAALADDRTVLRMG